MKKYLLLVVGMLCGMIAQAQTNLTLDQCQNAARENYPLLKQKELAQQVGDLTIRNSERNRWLPQLALNGQASWQSDVTSLPIELPNVPVPQLSKDQYKLTLDAGYTLYEGGLLSRQRQVQRTGTSLEQQRVEIELQRLKEQVNTLYLNALLTEEQIHLTQALRENLTNRIEKIAASVKFGTAAQTNLDALLAERLKTDQRLAELDATRRGLRDALGILTGTPMEENTILQVPAIESSENQAPQRPENKVYELQRSLADAQIRLADARWAPRISLFAQAGYGRPGLNFLNNDFQRFFIGGIRLSWNLSTHYTLRNDKMLLDITRQQVAAQQATFDRNLSVQLRQQRAEIERINGMLAKDQELVALRTKIRQTASVQLDNGLMAARDYVNELNDENQALLNQKLHELQRIMAQVQYQTLLGQ